MHWLDLQQDFFRPMWRRFAVVIVCLGWAIVEFSTNAPFWGILFGGVGLYITWQLFFDGWPGNSPVTDESSEKPE